jgi:hypothetical protein
MTRTVTVTGLGAVRVTSQYQSFLCTVTTAMDSEIICPVPVPLARRSYGNGHGHRAGASLALTVRVRRPSRSLRASGSKPECDGCCAAGRRHCSVRSGCRLKFCFISSPVTSMSRPGSESTLSAPADISELSYK